MDINKLCPHCMTEINREGEEPCPHCGYDFSKAKEVGHQLKPYTILAGKYLVGDVLGEGGFGITYIGLDLNLEIRVAIKEFYPNGYATRESQNTNALTAYAGKNLDVVYKWRDNFLKEARSLAKCSHLAGVVGVKDFFQENNTAYIVQEYLEGKTLKEYCKERGGKIAVEQLLNSLEPVIYALGEVHKEGLIHRDISPDNIMLLKGGRMKLLDFGAARDFTQEGEKSLSVLLKPGYAPEEQYRTKGNQGPWSDIYALAGTIYKCITGVTPPESMERMRKDELQKPSALGVSIPPHVEKALLKALAVYAEKRYQSIEEFHKDLYAQKLTVSSAENNSPNSGTQVISVSVNKEKLVEIQDVVIEKSRKAYGKAKEYALTLRNKLTKEDAGVLWNKLKEKVNKLKNKVVAYIQKIRGQEVKNESAEENKSKEGSLNKTVVVIAASSIIVVIIAIVALVGNSKKGDNFVEGEKGLREENSSVAEEKEPILIESVNPKEFDWVLAKTETYDNNNVFLGETEYFYDADYKQYKAEMRNADCALNTKYLYTYDDMGRVVEYNSIYADGSQLSSWVRIYEDADDLPEVVQWYDEEGKLDHYVEYQYNDMRQTVRFEEYNEAYELVNYKEFTFNEDNLRSGFQYYYSDGTLYQSGYYEYDVQGNEIHHEIYNSKNERIEYTNSVFENNNEIIYKKWGKDNTITLWNEMQYDCADNEVIRNYYNANGELANVVCSFYNPTFTDNITCINSNYGDLSYQSENVIKEVYLWYPQSKNSLSFPHDVKILINGEIEYTMVLNTAMEKITFDEELEVTNLRINIMDNQGFKVRNEKQMPRMGVVN